MLNREQLDGIRVKIVHKMSSMIGSKECELSNKELTSLLRLALNNIRSQAQLFDIFDEVLSERVAQSGINNEEFAGILEVIADHNQACP